MFSSLLAGLRCVLVLVVVILRTLPLPIWPVFAPTACVYARRPAPSGPLQLQRRIFLCRRCTTGFKNLSWLARTGWAAKHHFSTCLACSLEMLVKCENT